MATKPEGNSAGVTENGGADPGTQTGGGDDVAAIMAFDPFAPPKAGAPETPPAETTKSDAKPTADKKGAEATGTGKTGSSPDTATPKPDTPAAPAPAKTGAEATDFGKLFREQTDAIKALIKPAEPGKTSDDRPAPPKFNLGIPPQLMEAMASEDLQERTLATHALVNGIANAVWNEMTAHLKTELGTLVQGIPQMLEAHTTVQRTQQQVFQDFYGAHANLNKPEFQPLVLAAAQAVFQDLNNAGKEVAWNAEMRDAIAEKIYSAIPQLRPAAAPVKTNGGNSPAPAAPRFNPGGGARPSGGPAGPETDMLAVLGIRQ